MSQVEEMRMTRTVKGAVCAAKRAHGDLAQALCGLGLSKEFLFTREKKK